MIKLQRDNVVRLAATEFQAQKYERHGFVRVSEPDKSSAPVESGPKKKKTEGGE